MNERLIYLLHSVYGYVTLFLIVFVAPQDIHSWDLAVANEESIDFFGANGKFLFRPLINHSMELHDFYMVTYDPLNNRIFFNIWERDVGNIFTFNFSENTLTPLLPRQKHQALGMSYDTVTGSLYWTDGNGHAVWKRSLGDDSDSAEPILRFKTDKPAGIAISVCKRFLFWTNINHLSASVDRALLDGSDHKKIIFDDVFVPLALAVDELKQRLYWTDDQSGIYFKIESSDFDGTDRTLVIQGTNQEPIGIIALSNVLYWTDTVKKTVWKLDVDPLRPNGSEPEVFYKFMKVIPYGIAAFREKDFKCAPVATPPPTTENEPPSLERDALLEDAFCLNSGVRIGDECRCKRGFTGRRCQTSECHNFCLNGGRCFVYAANLPRCSCPSGWSGDRCQMDVCSGHCSNGGRCVLNGSLPSCSCSPGFSGEKCEISATSICNRQDFFGGLGRGSSNCSETSAKFDIGTLPYLNSLGAAHCQQQKVITIILLCAEALTLLVIVVLGRRICVLRRRPRIKKRIIINKGVKSQTPMTARPRAAASEHCEITIENCCNMNICETPCFEPNLRSPPRIASKSLPKKTDDKKKLLKNMEGDLDGSDDFYS